MNDVVRIDLAHAENFRLGRVEARPQLRQIVRDDGSQAVLEPRVMQVLVALARADGAIVSRDDLITACWDRRIVGEDAINRVISRLRRAAEDMGGASFRIETVTKVGYRLVVGESEAPRESRAPAARESNEARKLRLDRRAMLIGSGLAIVGAGSWWGVRHFTESGRDHAPPADVAPLMGQAMIAAQQGTAEGHAQALGLMRRVVELRPDYADGWGLLAMTYASSAVGGAPQLEADMRTRARDAAKRANALDPGNGYASAALDILQPQIEHWADSERRMRAALARHPRSGMLLGALGGMMISVGRCRESADLFTQAVAVTQPTPSLVYTHVKSLWAAGRLDEADRAMDAAFALYPSHFAVWFTRYYLFLYTGRAREALAMSANVDGRPTGVPEFNFPMIDSVARAMLSQKPADIDAAMRLNLDAAHKGRGFAENAIQFASALGRIDTGFSIAEAYFFNRGFRIGEYRFAPE